MKSLSLCVLTLLLSSGYSWTTQGRGALLRVRLSMSDAETSEDPCWQDLYDDDCSMSSVYAASFVAGKWIKSMPCANSLDEDCDMGNLDIPENRPEAGVDNVDVMDFLGLKKAENLSKSDDKDVSP